MQNILRYSIQNNKIILSRLIQGQKQPHFGCVSSYYFAESNDPTEKPPKKMRLFQSGKPKETPTDKEGEDKAIFNKFHDKHQQKAFKGKPRHEETDQIESIQKPEAFQANEPHERQEKGQSKTSLFSHKERERAKDTKYEPKGKIFQEDVSKGKQQREKEIPKKREIKLFAKKEIEKGYILDRLAIDLQKDADTVAPPEVTDADRETIINKINTFKNLENTPKKFQNLMELQMILEEHKNVQDTYFEAQKLKINKNPVIENLMFEACIASSYEKAEEFYKYLKSQNKLEEVFFNNMCDYIALQSKSDDYQTLNHTLHDLKAINYNIGDLDISIFNNIFGFNRPRNTRPLEESINKADEFLKKSELFIDYLVQILRKKPENVETFPYLFKFQQFFRTLNHLSYPDIKLNSHGNDICLYYLDILGKHGLLSSNFVNFEDLNKWIASYYQLPVALPRITQVISKIQGRGNFFPIFVKSLNHYILNNDNLPFDAKSLRDAYIYHKEEIAKSKRPLEHELIQVFLELAQIHKQYDIVFDIYENAGKLLQTTKTPSYIFKAMANTFTYMKLSSENCTDIVENLIKEAESNNEEKLSDMAVTIFKLKALINDKRYAEAHSLFENQFLDELVIQQQKVLIFCTFCMMMLRAQPLREEDRSSATPDISYEMGLLKDFINGMSKEDVYDVYKRLENDNEVFKKYYNDENIAAHINKWNEYIKNPPTPAQLQAEIEAQQAAAQASQEAEANAAGEGSEEGKEGEEQAEEAAAEEAKDEEKNILTYDEVDEYLTNKIKLGRPEVDQESKNLIVKEGTEGVNEQFDFENLDKEMIIAWLAEYKAVYNEMKTIVKLQLKNQSKKRKGSFSPLSEEAEKPMADYVNDFMMWGFYKNEPLAIQLGELFYETIGHQLPDYLANQLNIYYKYKAIGELNKEGNSFSYTESYVRKPVSSVHNPKSDYEVVQDDRNFNKFINDMKDDPTYHWYHERFVKSQVPIKEIAFGLKIPVVEKAKKNLEEFKKIEKKKINLVNYQ